MASLRKTTWASADGRVLPHANDVVGREGLEGLEGEFGSPVHGFTASQVQNLAVSSIARTLCDVFSPRLSKLLVDSAGFTTSGRQHDAFHGVVLEQLLRCQHIYRLNVAAEAVTVIEGRLPVDARFPCVSVVNKAAMVACPAILRVSTSSRFTNYVAGSLTVGKVLCSILLLVSFFSTSSPIRFIPLRRRHMVLHYFAALQHAIWLHVATLALTYISVVPLCTGCVLLAFSTFRRCFPRAVFCVLLSSGNARPFLVLSTAACLSLRRCHVSPLFISGVVAC